MFREFGDDIVVGGLEESTLNSRTPEPSAPDLDGRADDAAFFSSLSEPGSTRITRSLALADEEVMETAMVIRE